MQLQLSSSQITCKLLECSTEVLVTAVRALLEPCYSVYLSDDLVGLATFSPPGVLTRKGSVPFSGTYVADVVYTFSLSYMVAKLVERYFVWG